jgi:hypothetical protein
MQSAAGMHVGIVQLQQGQLQDLKVVTRPAVFAGALPVKGAQWLQPPDVQVGQQKVDSCYMPVMAAVS